MGIVNFLLQNWDSVLVVIAAVVAVIVLVVKKQYAILDKVIFSIVTEAERNYGSDMGAMKLAAVINCVYSKIPAVLRIFISSEQLERLVERVLAEARERWAKSPGLSAYISGKEDS